MRGRVWAGFAALLLLLGSEWIADLAAPRVLPGVWGAGVRLALLASIFALSGLRGAGSWGGWRLAAWGAVLLTAMPLAEAGGAGSVTGLTALLVAALVPAAVVFAVAQGDGDEGGLTLIGPALAAFGGLALLVAYTVPSSVRGLAWLGALLVAAVATGFAVVEVHRLLAGVRVLRGAAMIAAGGALALLIFCWAGPFAAPVFAVHDALFATGRLLLVDLPVTLLSVWLLREMLPTAYAVRYVLGLFIAVAESFAVARPGWTWTMLAATALVGGGSWWLLRARPARTF